MNPVRALITTALFAGLAACSQVPLAGTYPVSSQQKMQSVSHWQSLADDIAAEVAPIAGKRPVYVQPMQTETRFGQALHGYLTTALIEKGVATGPQQPDSLVLITETQLVSHSETPTGWPTGVGTLAGALAGYGGQLSEAAPSGMLLGSGVLVDAVAGGIAVPTRTELIVTTNLQDTQYVWKRASRSFYVRDADWTHYEPAPPRSPGVPVLPAYTLRREAY